MTAQTATGAETSGAAGAPTRKTVAIIVAALTIPLALVALWKFLPMNDYLRDAVAWISATGPVGVLVFYLVYVACALIGIPRTLLNIAAGVLFSYPVAIASVLAAAASAYVLTFTIARTVARDWVNQRLAEAPNVKKLMDLVDEEGFKLVLLIRMNPFIPGVLKGYGFGTTNVRFSTYFIASVLGFLPIALSHVYLGWIGGEAMLSDEGGPTELERWLMFGGVVVSVLLVASLYVYGRRAMNQRYGEGGTS